MKKVDIIIPIYNTCECLKQCIDSVIKNTDLKNNKLIIYFCKKNSNKINDLLKKYTKETSTISLFQISNDLNYSQVINEYIRKTKNDIVIMDANIEVEKNWLEKIQLISYQEDNVGTVSPITNNSQYMLMPNTNNYTLKEINEVIENSSYKEYPEIPVANEMCIYLKKEVINEVGYLDEDNFKSKEYIIRDYSYRCSELGYKNLLADNIVVKNNKKDIIELEADEIRMSEIHPIKSFRRFKYIKDNPIIHIKNNNIYNMNFNNNKKNILILIHDWELDISGGTTAHAFDIIKSLKHKFNFHVLSPILNQEYMCLHSYFENEEVHIEMKEVKTDNFTTFNFYNKIYKNNLEKIIDSLGIDIIHIHHMLKHYFDIFDIAKEKDVELIISLHDYYTICPKYTMIEDKYGYCENKRDCSNCLKEKFSSKNNANLFIEKWRETWYKNLKNAKSIIVPSDSTKEIILEKYNDLNIEVINHGIDLKKEISNLKIENDEIINIAFIGIIKEEKGAKLLQDLVSNLEKKEKIKIHLFGKSSLKLTKNKNFIDHGRYYKKDLKELLISNDIKLICLLSICPETYSYTLSESNAIGIPVLGFDIGAIGSRIRKDDTGWLLDYKSDYQKVLEKLKEIKQNKEDYSNKIRNINKHHIITIEEMIEKYLKIYQELPKKREHNKVLLKELIKENTKEQIIININNNEWVFDTFKWKLISKIKIPKLKNKKGEK